VLTSGWDATLVVDGVLVVVEALRGVGLFVAIVVVVDETGNVFVVVVVVVVALDGAVVASGDDFDVAESVSTKTNSSGGLDHVNQCVLLRDRRRFIRVHEE
jgi:hypothetical protein